MGTQGTGGVLEHRAAHGEEAGRVWQGPWSVEISAVAACENESRALCARTWLFICLYTRVGSELRTLGYSFVAGCRVHGAAQSLFHDSP